MITCLSLSPSFVLLSKQVTSAYCLSALLFICLSNASGSNKEKKNDEKTENHRKGERAKEWVKNNLFTDTLTPTVFSPLHRLPQLKQQGHCIRMLSKPFLAGCVWCTTHTHKHCIQKCVRSDSNTTLERKISVCLYLWTILASLLKHFVLPVMLFLDMYFELWEHLHRVYSLNFKITFRVWEVCACGKSFYLYF